MLSRAISRYNRISPKKARLLTRRLKGLTVAEAYAILMNVNKRASRLIYALLRSAFDNAKKKEPAIKETDVYISRLVADSGPMLRRYRAASMGRASMIRKRTSHLTVHLDAKELPKKEEKTKKAAAKRRPIFKKKETVAKKQVKHAPAKKKR
jgi:large subunit ribosomal protein L22